jgi:hypothetical protein
MILHTTILSVLIGQIGPKTQVIDSVTTFMLLFIAMVLLGLFSIWLLIATLWIDNSTVWLATKRKYADLAVKIGPVLTALMLVLSGHMAWKVLSNSANDPMPGKAILFFAMYCTLGPIFGLVSSLFAFRFRKRMYN